MPARHPANSFLQQRPANYTPLSPVAFLGWAAITYPDKTAVVYGRRSHDYREFDARCRRLASALAAWGIAEGDTVAVMAPNIPALLECHYGVPMCGAVLNALNIRLDAATIRFILEHGGARILIVDYEYGGLIEEVVAQMDDPPRIVGIEDPAAGPVTAIGEIEYESLLAQGDAGFDYVPPADEWQSITLSYTSGTTGNPKGVLYHHRGAYLQALGNSLSFRLDADSVYLWTLPMFHCNGWSYTWAVTAVGGTHVCLRRVEPAEIFDAILAHRVTHMCGAPIVLNMLVNADPGARREFPQRVEIATGGAAPPSAVIAGAEAMGFRVTHLYGLTESFGPATVCVWQQSWDELDGNAQAEKIARQGVRLPTLSEARVIDPASMIEVPADGETIGEIMLRGNTAMKGYLGNETATEECFDGGWLHTGDLAVLHPDGYIEIKDRSKDIIISGGENLSSLEIEQVLYQHPAVLEAAVVARADERWGEVPCAFVTLKTGALADEVELIEFCRQRMAHFKAPKKLVFTELPKTATGKIQKNRLREMAAAIDQPA